MNLLKEALHSFHTVHFLICFSALKICWSGGWISMACNFTAQNHISPLESTICHWVCSVTALHKLLCQHGGFLLLLLFILFQIKMEMKKERMTPKDQTCWSVLSAVIKLHQQCKVALKCCCCDAMAFLSFLFPAQK